MEQTIITMAPEDLAELIGLPRADGAAWGVPVRVTRDWKEKMLNRVGPLELDSDDVAMLLGKTLRFVKHLRQSEQIIFRKHGPAKRHAVTYTPAALVAYLRRHQATAPAPETDAQFEERGRRAQEMARLACRGGG